MSRLLIIGAGGHGKVVAEAALEGGQWSEIVFLDDRYPDLRQLRGWPVIGKTEEAKKLPGEYGEAVVAIGDAKKRIHFLSKLDEIGFDLPSVVHPAAWVSSSARLGDGCVVFAQAAINADVRIGRGGIINTGATVDHDCRLGEGVHVCPGVHIAGNVEIESYVWIGIGANLIHGLYIASNVTIAAGAAVVTDVEEGATVGGVPAAPLRRRKADA